MSTEEKKSFEGIPIDRNIFLLSFQFVWVWFCVDVRAHECACSPFVCEWVCVNDDITCMQGFSHIPIWPSTKAYTLQRHGGLDQTQWVQVGGECTQLSPWLHSLHLWCFSCLCLQEPHSLQHLNLNVNKWVRIKWSWGSNKSDVGTWVQSDTWPCAFSHEIIWFQGLSGAKCVKSLRTFKAYSLSKQTPI